VALVRLAGGRVAGLVVLARIVAIARVLRLAVTRVAGVRPVGVRLAVVGAVAVLVGLQQRVAEGVHLVQAAGGGDQMPERRALERLAVLGLVAGPAGGAPAHQRGRRRSVGAGRSTLLIVLVRLVSLVGLISL